MSRDRNQGRKRSHAETNKRNLHCDHSDQSSWGDAQFPSQCAKLRSFANDMSRFAASSSSAGHAMEAEKHLGLDGQNDLHHFPTHRHGTTFSAISAGSDRNHRSTFPDSGMLSNRNLTFRRSPSRRGTEYIFTPPLPPPPASPPSPIHTNINTSGARHFLSCSEVIRSSSPATLSSQVENAPT